MFKSLLRSPDAVGMGGRAVVTVAVGLLCAGGLAVFPRIEAAMVADRAKCPGSGDVPTPSTREATSAVTLCLLNRERARHGLPPLHYSGALEHASQAHSDDMAARGYFAHDSPDGIDPTDRMRGAGYPVDQATTGENIAWGTEAAATPVRIVDGWMQSPGHRANILRRGFTEVGVGVTHAPAEPGADGRAATYTTDFGGVGR